MLAPVTEARLGEEALLALNHGVVGRWPAFAAEVEAAAGRPVGYRADGTLVVALDADDRAALDELVARHRAMGLEVDALRGPRGPRPRSRAWRPACGPGCWRRASARSTPRRWSRPCWAAAEAVGVTVRATGRAGWSTTAPGDRGRADRGRAGRGRRCRRGRRRDGGAGRRVLVGRRRRACPAGAPARPARSRARS